jgi:hypothetical protein
MLSAWPPLCPCIDIENELRLVLDGCWGTGISVYLHTSAGALLSFVLHTARKRPRLVVSHDSHCPPVMHKALPCFTTATPVTPRSMTPSDSLDMVHLTWFSFAGKEGLVFKGPALVFDCEEDMVASLAKDPASFKGKVVVIRCVAWRGVEEDCDVQKF